MFILLTTSILTLAFSIQPVKAIGTIYIRADGSIDPPDAPISTVDNVTYTLTGNITSDADGIEVERSNIIIDGDGYRVEGTEGRGGYGLSLSGITNVTIESTNIKSFGVGIRLAGSSGNSISENNVANNMVGIRLEWGSYNNSISGNHLANNYYGIDLGIYCPDNSIVGNVFAGCGLLVSYPYGNKVDGNTVNGKPLVYLEGVSDFTVEDAGQVILVNCNNIRVENLDLSNATQSVQLWRTSNTIIADNNIANNSYYGINLQFSSNNNTMSGNNITNNSAGISIRFNSESSSNNSISGNNITNNEYGIDLESSSYNSISGNNITANNNYGIVILWSSEYNSIFGNNITNNGAGVRLFSSSNNRFYHNDFIDNTKQVSSYDSVNFWGVEYPLGGNYWSDYNGVDANSDGIGDTPHVIDADNQDRYPLMHPWSPLPVHNINTGLGYDTIQEAINAPETLERHIIFVETGTYYENVVVNKTVLLLGESVGTTIIDASGTGNVIDVRANGVVIEGFTLQNSGYDASGIHIGDIIMDNVTIRNNILINNDCGIDVMDSWYNTISGNNITNNYYGILLQYSSENTLRNNRMSGNQRNFWVFGDIPNYFYHDIDSSNTVDGKPMYYWFNQQNQTVPADAGYVALVYSANITAQNLTLNNNSQGVLLVQTSNSIIKGNNITNNRWGVSLLFSSNNTVSENNIIDSGSGIVISDSSNNTICGNDVRNNYFGIDLSNLYVPFSNNTIYHNNFMNNTEQVFISGHPSYANFWDGGYPSGGNYWSDYSAPDLYRGPYQNITGSDGIGDTPLAIDADNVDNYPLMKPYAALIGDVNGDEKVDMKDVMAAVQAFNSFPGQPRWNPNADIDNNGRVDMRDLVIIVLNFNRHE